MEHSNTRTVVRNKKASFNYFLSDYIECGVVLVGTEIKSIREGGANISDSYVIIRNGEAFILNMHIAPYSQGNIMNHEPLRTRKLLLHKREINKIEAATTRDGYTIIPVEVSLKRGKCKITIALGKGKKLYDKREDKKAKDDKRMIDREIKERNNR